MKHLLWIVLTVMSLASCGEFFGFDDERHDEWNGVTMRILNDSAFVMVGDSMALGVEFSAHDVKERSVFWSLSDDACARLSNDTLVAVRPGSVYIMAVGGLGRFADTCRVNVIDRWTDADFNRQQPSDMVIYADITLDGQPWDDATVLVGAFVRGELAGMAVPRQALGVRYAEIRVWALADENVGRVELRCYDRRRFRMKLLREEIDFSATRTLGTLSRLYPVNF